MKNQEEIREILERDYITKAINAQSVENVGLHPGLFRGNVKVALGAIYTNKEFDELRDEVLNLKLP